MTSRLLPCKIDKKTLILGAGGGFDIYTCLPWYLTLTKDEQDQCVLANYSFTDDLYKYETHMNEWIIEINSGTPSTKKNNDYFPEKFLSISIDKPIYAIRLIPNPLLETELEKFVVKHEIAQIILVDGGVDSCLYGDESSFGSPLEDSQTLIACHHIAQRHQIPCKLMCSALYVDEVSESVFLSHWDEMTKKNFQCNVVKLTKDNYPIERHKKILNESIFASIIQESIVAAIEGSRGRYNNPRLFFERIDDPKEMPDLHDETTNLWWLDVAEYMSYSPFYRELKSYNPAIDVIKDNNDHIHKLWNLWDRRIDHILQRGKYNANNDDDSE